MAALLDIVKKGSTDRSVTIRIIDSGDGTPETGVVFNTTGIDLWYRREGATKISITEADLTTPALDDAHADGGFLHIGDGEYRLDLPDAAFATAANHVDIGGTVTGMVVIGGRVRLVDYDPEDAVRMGQTALPNAAADAAGGLPVSAAGSLDLDAKLAATNEITAARMGALTDWINGGRLDLLLDSIITAVITNAAGADLAADIAAAKTVLDTAAGDVVNIDGAAMRGTDDAALASELGSAVGASISADIAAIKTIVDLITAKTTNLPSDPADQSLLIAATNSILAVLGTPAGADMSADIAAIKAIDDAIKLVTDAMPNSGALTSLAQEATLGSPAGASLAADLAAIKAVDDAIKAITDLFTATDAEPTGVPAVNETPLVKLAYLFMALRNGLTLTATKKQFLDDSGAAEWEKDVSDDGTTYAETKGNAP